MINIVDLAAHAQATVEEINARLDDVIARHSDKVDMPLMLEVMDDLMNARLTTGDIAAVYAYRLGKRRQS